MRSVAIPIYSRVRLTKDRFRPEGVEYGAVGYVIEVYGDGSYEVEFSDPQGITIAQIVAPSGDLEVYEPTTRSGQPPGGPAGSAGGVQQE
jgi:hypothetical protein